MHPQIAEILADYRNASARLEALAARVPEEQWAVRPDPDRWSVSENIEHLNLLDEAFLPIFRDGIERARTEARQGKTAPARYRRDPLGWFMWKVMPPPVRRMRVKAVAGYVPGGDQPAAEIRARFASLQTELVALTTAADGLPVDRVRIVSPVSEKARYNLFAAMGIIPRHQHRHLWQAEQTWFPVSRG